MRSAFLLAICLHGFFAGSWLCFVQPASAAEVRHREKKAPPYLFFWTTQARLHRLDARNPNPEKLPLKLVQSKHGVVLHWPESAIDGKQALFSWDSPIGAMKYTSIDDVFTGAHEYYAGHSGKDVPALMVMRPKPNARVLTLRSTYAQPNPKNAGRLIDKADLVFHEVLNADGSVRYHEWLVVNPDAIEDFTADPARIPPEVRARLRRSLDPRFDAPKGELFHPVDTFGDYERERIKTYLSSKSEDVPPALRRDLGAKGPGCGAKFSGLVNNR